ncbi:MAG: cell envelope integrity protein CreD [Alphaproteobacteria bacterium]|nr:cell envelope integrity protein CreD [Alphaproteobacteria bacterium]
MSDYGTGRAGGGLGGFLRSPGVKAIVVGVLILAMAVPMVFVSFLVADRANRALEVRAEIGTAWGGGAQSLGGPFLIVPVDEPRTRVVDQVETRYFERGHLVILPEALSVEAGLEVGRRHRSIHEVLVYGAGLALSGAFLVPDLAGLVEEGARILWDEAYLSLEVSDNRGFKGETRFLWGETRTALAVEPSPRLGLFTGRGAHARVPGLTAGASIPFALQLTLNGSESLRLLPVGRDTVVRLSAAWPHPSFQGAFLPTTSRVGADGFEAEWQVPAIARSFGQVFRAETRPSLGEAAFGVDLHSPVTFYRKVERATKYAILFFGFVFLTVFLAETLAGGRVHAVQYLLVGASQCVFYLLLLSLAEHLGFRPAYAIAAGANVALVSLYGGVVLGSVRLFLILLGVLLTVYGLLYSLLELEDHALLFGSIATFLALAITMFATRRVDWYGRRLARTAD